VFLLCIDFLRAFKIAIIADNETSLLQRSWLFYRYNLASGFYSLVLPGILFGGGVRWLYFRKTVGGNDAAYMVIIDNYSQIIAVFLLFTPAAFFLPGGSIAGCTALLLTAALVAIPFILKFFRYAPAPKFTKLNRFRASLDYASGKLSAFRFLCKQSAAIFAVSFIYQCLVILFIWICTTAAGYAIEWHLIIFAITGLTIVLFIPGLLGGLGIREASLAGMLVPLGVPMEEAVLLGLLLSLLTILRGLAGGIPALMLKGGK
jgi:uncharacterized membrane protein YbhN (UPF0104 family)